jgi:hypothetical protein
VTALLKAIHLGDAMTSEDLVTRWQEADEENVIQNAFQSFCRGWPAVRRAQLRARLYRLLLAGAALDGIGMQGAGRDSAMTW